MKEPIIITIAGLRKWMGEENVAKFQQANPVGSTLYLQLQGGDGPYARSVIAFDSSLQTVGSVASCDSFIARQLFTKEDGTLLFDKEETATIVSHINLATRVAIRNIGQLDHEPYLLLQSPEPGESVLPFTEEEKAAKRLSAHIHNELQDGNITANKIKELIPCIKKYAEICDCSLCGNGIYEMRRIVHLLDTIIAKEELMEQGERTELLQIKEGIYGKANDMAKEDYRFERYKETLSYLRKNMKPFMEKWLKALEFGVSDQQQIQELHDREKEHLIQQLKSSIEGKFAEFYDDQLQLANQIYYQKYSRETLYLLLTRLLKYEYLAKNIVREYSTDNKLKEAIERLLDAKDDKGEYLMNRQQHWFCVYRVLYPDKDKAQTAVGFVNDMKQLFPEGTRLPFTDDNITKPNIGSFTRPVEKWVIENNHKGATFQRYKEVAETFKNLLKETGYF